MKSDTLLIFVVLFHTFVDLCWRLAHPESLCQLDGEGGHVEKYHLCSVMPLKPAGHTTHSCAAQVQFKKMALACPMPAAHCKVPPEVGKLQQTTGTYLKHHPNSQMKRIPPQTIGESLCSFRIMLKCYNLL